VIRLSLDWRTDVNVNPSPSEALEAVMAQVRGALVTRTIAIPAGQDSALEDCHSREPPPPLRGRTLRLVGVPLSVRRVSHQRRQAPSSYIWLATERRAERTTEPSPPTALRSPLRLCVEPERARGNEWVGGECERARTRRDAWLGPWLSPSECRPSTSSNSVSAQLGLFFYLLI
jgi:hypothetical protein